MSAAAITLATANVTAYSGIVIDPVVVAFAFLAWLPDMQVRRAAFYTLWLIGVSALVFALLIIASHSWSGLLFTVIARNIADHQDTVTILSNSWAYVGMLVVLATIGSITACSTERRSRASLLVLLVSRHLLCLPPKCTIRPPGHSTSISPTGSGLLSLQWAMVRSADSPASQQPGSCRYL